MRNRWDVPEDASINEEGELVDKDGQLIGIDFIDEDDDPDPQDKPDNRVNVP